MPPTNSSTPANQNSEPNAGAGMSEAGKPKSFIVPCSMKSSAVTIRRTASACGA